MNISEIINQKNTTLVDVRNLHEFEPLHAEGAIHIPLREVPAQLENFKEMSKPIVVYCASGNRSSQAMNFLKSQGIEDVYNGGGIFQVLDCQNQKHNN